MMIGVSPFSVNFLHGAVFHGQEFLGRRSIRSPLEHFRLCRTLLLRIQQDGVSEETLKETQNLSRYTFSESYQPSIAALALLSKAIGKNHSPVVPMLWPSGAPMAMKEEARRNDCLLPLPIAWQLSQIWNELGRLEDDGELIEKAHLAKKWVERFADRAKLLFYREESFDANEAEGFSLSNELNSAVDLHLGMAAFSSLSVKACVSLSGWNSGLGTIKLGDVLISSFGPQTAPLSDATGFGISQTQSFGCCVIITEEERIELEGWTRCYGRKESWLYLKTHLSTHVVQFDTRFVEGETDSSLYMVFYVKADKCCTENSGKSFFPGSLQRYIGKCSAVFLNDLVRLGCSGANQELQIIPLAGEGCFWNANFLIAFSCPSNSFVSFELSVKNGKCS